jgi:hypothetical protein
MIRYSTSRSTIRLASPNTPTELVSPIERAYRELQELREQVKKAEAAAKRPLPRGQLKACSRPVPRVVSRRPIARQRKEITKRELYTMLAEAIRNTTFT